jgi:hypothetical protein
MVLTHKIPTFYNRINRQKRVAKYIEQAMDLFQLELHEGWWAGLKALFITHRNFFMIPFTLKCLFIVY